MNNPIPSNPRRIVVGIGEVLWDLFPNGKKMGGAPANFAYHARSLGAEARVVSRVGNDTLGREILAQLEAIGLSSQCISVDLAHPTGTVSVELTADGQPHYVIREAVAWDHLVADAAAFAAVSDADAVCFGSLAQRCAPARAAIRTLLAHAPRTALRIFDVNLRQDFFSKELIERSLEVANVLKLNETELPVLARLLGVRGLTDRQQLAELAERFALRLVAYTCGARGSILYDGTRWSEQAGRLVEVKDTVGAGDSLTAAVTMGMLAGRDLETIGERASDIAAYVCSCEGGTPPLPEHLRDSFKSIGEPERQGSRP
jgi:fructokinase